MPFAMKTLGLGAGFIAFVMSVAGEVYRDEHTAGQRTVGWLTLVFAIVGIIAAIGYGLEIRNRIDRCERALRAAGGSAAQESE